MFLLIDANEYWKKARKICKNKPPTIITNAAIAGIGCVIRSAVCTEGFPNHPGRGLYAAPTLVV
jgi:hypothetical protein